MDKLYFSENNIATQTKKLILNLELPEEQINRDVVLKCKKIICLSTIDTYSNLNSFEFFAWSLSLLSVDLEYLLL